MKFMMLVCIEETRDVADEAAEAADSTEENESFPWLDDVIARGIRLDGDRLAPTREARTVAVRDGEMLVSDGPFAETKEVICGYDVLDCANIDERSRWPQRIRWLRSAGSRSGRSGGADSRSGPGRSRRRPGQDLVVGVGQPATVIGEHHVVEGTGTYGSGSSMAVRACSSSGGQTSEPEASGGPELKRQVVQGELAVPEGREHRVTAPPGTPGPTVRRSPRRTARRPPT